MNEPKAYNIFPVVHRIREEIDFCFSSFYGNAFMDQSVCDQEFDAWVKQGYRGPGQLSIYIEMLEKHLPTTTQSLIFSNLANDCITIVKKSPKGIDDSALQKSYFWLWFALGVCGLLFAAFYFLMPDIG